MCGFTITNRDIQDLDYVDEFTRLRGPDGTNVTKFGRLTIIHHLLAITGRETPQPFVDNELVCVFNGQIYNYQEFGDYESDGECLIPLFRKYGNEFTNYLDGEYAIVIIDLRNYRVSTFCDIFATKPCYYSRDGSDFAISSYASSIKRLGFSEWSTPQRAPHDFSLVQFKTSYEDWAIAFERAIKKRLPDKPLFIGLSSGFDSGAIDCALRKQRVSYTAISVGEEYIEGRESMRVPLPEDITSVDMSLVDLEFEYEILRDVASYGQTILFKTAKELGQKVCLSGQGADEVMWGYNPNNFAAHNQVLGKHFYEGKQNFFLGKEERIAGAHGIESRYPFLDKDVVQEYLWLSVELKNRYYKAPIHDYLSKNGYPFNPGVKQGFGMGISGQKHHKVLPTHEDSFKLYEKLLPKSS
jgi:asparagine synthetase B (glutamine-hydrolysing)